jgi:hypothetical protein
MEPGLGLRKFCSECENNYVHAPGKFVALVGVSNLVIVETEDALLVTTLDQSQDVGKVVKHLDEKKLRNWCERFGRSLLVVGKFADRSWMVVRT